MSIKIDKRGRGKYKPATNYDSQEVREVLESKIKQESQAIVDLPEDYDRNKLSYKNFCWESIIVLLSD